MISVTTRRKKGRGIKNNPLVDGQNNNICMQGVPRGVRFSKNQLLPHNTTSKVVLTSPTDYNVRVSNENRGRGISAINKRRIGAVRVMSDPTPINRQFAAYLHRDSVDPIIRTVCKNSRSPSFIRRFIRKNSTDLSTPQIKTDIPQSPRTTVNTFVAPSAALPRTIVNTFVPPIPQPRTTINIVAPPIHRPDLSGIGTTPLFPQDDVDGRFSAFIISCIVVLIIICILAICL